LLAVSVAVDVARQDPGLNSILAAVFFLISVVFVYRSFYGMRIEK